MRIKFLFFVLLLSYHQLLIAGNYELYGTITAYNPNGNEVPLDNVQVSSFYNGITKSGKTDKNGDFKIPFPKDKNSTPLEAGAKLNIKVEDERWTILSPKNGEFFIPKYANNEKIEIFVIANDSTIVFNGLKAQFKSEDSPIIESYNVYYTIQVLSTNSKTKAELTKQEFEMANYKAHIERKRSKYRVTVGSFNTWIEAKQQSDLIRNSFSRRYDDCFIKPAAKH